MKINEYNEMNLDYKNRNILLSKEDFEKNIELEISPHKVKGSYISYKNYLNTMFYLEFEDCYRALKKDMYELQSHQKSINLMNEDEIANINKNSNLYLYLDGIIRNFYFGENGVLIKMDFRPSIQSRLNSKMMKNGSLIILSNNNFENYIFTTVYSNEIKLVNDQMNIYRVSLSLLDINKNNVLFLIKNRNNLQVFESKAYFESYIHVMRRLQEMNEYNLPFEQELIFGNFESIKINNNPIKINLPLDPSQLNAVNNSLSNKISLIQGPPGTGKTYVGIILVRALLELEPNSQILIVSYTNHALDSFLEEITKYTQNMVRVGGGCKNEIVLKYHFNSSGKDYNELYKEYLKELHKDGKEVKNFINDTIYCDDSPTFKNVKSFFKILYDKVKSDFFKLAIIKDNFYINYDSVYILWNLLDIIDDAEFKERIYSLLSEERNPYNERKVIFNQLYNNCKEFNQDNLLLLNALYNNYTMFTNNININKSNFKEDNDEEEDCNDAFCYINNSGETSEEEEIIENDDIVYNRLPPLSQAGFEFLMKCGINAFKFGPKIIRLIKDYMKYWFIENNIDFNNFNFQKFNDTLNKKSDYSLLNKYKIVGMTTTGCAKYSKILEKSNFETIIVEEAAEVLESRIVSLLTKNTKRLILIGDHKQLRPKPYNYDLETKKNFNISMFERLINNNIKYSPLVYQRRMKSIFADFVRIIYGDDLYKDHESVKNKEKVNGLKYDMFIITHNKEENYLKETKSKFNIYEAKYLVKLCEYLLKQGYQNNQITVLTFYLEQVKKIKSILNELKINDIRVSSIDNYQGEECDIILLSLVRSNKNNKIGFLNNFNRVCVAFSRAKIGLYIIGNIECILKGEEQNKNNDKNKNVIDSKMKDVWQKIYDKAKKLNIIGDKLILCCQHKTEINISELEDFDKLYKENWCKEICNKEMDCGHKCQNICHIGIDCNKFECRQPCKRIKLNCSLNKHICRKLCYENCELCEEIVEKKLPCEHKKECKCCMDINLLKCEEKCGKKLQCGHPCQLKCCENCNSQKCREICNKEMNCGHECQNICHLGLDCNKFICYQPCKRILPCGHPCQLKCCEDCNSQVCKQKIEFDICSHINEIECFTLNYSHIFKNICKQKCTIKKLCNHPCNGTCDECLEGTLHKQCEEKCNKILLCGHNCNKKCYKECICTEYSHTICPHINSIFKCGDKIICKEKCNIECKHKKCSKRCDQLCNRKPCEKRCDKKMKCGHQCFGLCGERCPKICKVCNPDEKYFSNIQENELLYETSCGHIFSVNELDKYFYNNERNIEIYRCPECSNFLLYEPRYQNQIKIFFMNIHEIKKNIIEKYSKKNIDIILKLMKEIINRISEQYEIWTIRIFDLYSENKNDNSSWFYYNKFNLKNKMPIIYNFIHNINNNYSTFKLLTLAEKFMAIEYYMNEILNNNDIKNVLRNEFKFIQNYLKIKKYFENAKEGNLVINDDLYQNLKNKVDNMVYYLIIKLKNNNEYSSENKNLLLNKIKDIYISNFSSNLDLKDIFKENNEKINIEIVNLNMSFESKWYKCKNGHYYSISKYDLISKKHKCLKCEQRKIKFKHYFLCLLFICTLCTIFFFVFLS